MLPKKNVVSDLQKTQEEKEEIIKKQKETEAKIQTHLKDEIALLSSKQAAIDGIKAARATMENELKNQKKTTAALEKTIARKEALIPKEEYVAKRLQQLSLHKREIMPPGAVSYFVSSYFGMQYRANSGMNFLLKETHLVSNFIKTQLREQTAAIRKRRDEALALVPAVPSVTLPSLNLGKTVDMCKTVVTKGPRSLMARLKSFGVNVDLFPKGYGGYGATTSPIKKKPASPESKEESE